MFWLSQPSAIDGAVWPHFDAFVQHMAEVAPEAHVIPDLTYVGSVARDYRISLDMPNVPAFIVSQSKPFGGYYQRSGGVFLREDSPSLFGNRWFKNLQSLAWAVEMMDRHDVHDLPRRYRAVQEAACADAAARLGIAELRRADVMLLATAPLPAELPPLLASLVRGGGNERRIRLCLTPAMTLMIDPRLAPITFQALQAPAAEAV